MPLSLVLVSTVPALHQVRRETIGAFQYPYVAVLCLSDPHAGVAPGATQNGGSLPVPTWYGTVPEFSPWARRTRCNAR
jgi:hypothetical protein